MEERREGTVCFFIDNNNILLAQIRYPDGTKRWNGIGGFADLGESPIEALIREIKEEINLDINESDLQEKIVLEDYPGIRLHVFLGSLKDKKPDVIDPTIEEIRWFDYAEIPYDQMWEGNDKWLQKILGL